jgi:diguanylate cyclase (GGDEF)-like protein
LDPGYTALQLALAAGLGVVCGLLLAVALGGSRSAAAADARRLLHQERAESERAMVRLRRELQDLEQRSRENDEVFQILPDLLRQMFSASGRRNIAPLALKMMDQLFRPAQSAFFAARPAQRRLALLKGQGLPASLALGFEIEYGQSRIGHVAELQLAMDEGDFQNATALVRRHLEATAVRELQAEVVAPIAIDEEGGLLGVICLGGARNRRGQEKRLLRMVADLTAVAITQATRLRTTEEAANVDGLTGVFNKRYLQKRLGDELLRAEREQQPLALLILDIDHFKHYNDTNGHLEGDEVLKRLGKILRGSIREDDVAARYGGEEFVVLYSGVGKADALRLAEGLRRAVEAASFAHGALQPLGALTISGGVAAFPEDSATGVELLRAADHALYEAKKAGRNGVRAASPNYLT